MKAHKYTSKQSIKQKKILCSTSKRCCVIFPKDWKLLTVFKRNTPELWLRGMPTISGLYFKYQKNDGSGIPLNTVRKRIFLKTCLDKLEFSYTTTVDC